MSPEVLVVLSAYNGARFIKEQIESIRAQTFRDWMLLIRDDGSSDETVEIITQLMNVDPRITLLEDSLGNVGAWRSFGLLLSEAKERGANYLFFSDQDDAWLEPKMSAQLDLLRALEHSSRKSPPVLVHSDLVVVDEKLRRVHPSFREFQHMAYDEADPLGTLLLHNAIVGCTIGINRPLLELADPLPENAPHDWWLALCAAGAGTIASVTEPMVLYRQHASNVIGAQTRRGSLARLTRTPIRFGMSVFKAIDESAAHAATLEQRLTERQPSATDEQARIRRYRDAFANGSIVSRFRALRQSGVRPTRRLSRALFPAIVASFPLYRMGRGTRLPKEILC